MADHPLPLATRPSDAVSRLPVPGDVIASKYRIEATLGTGGMGVVLLAENLAIGQKVAIKFISAVDEQHRAEATQRLLREARAAAALRGEHVVRVYDVGESAEGAPFIVMELLEGLDLGEVVDDVSRLAISDAVGLLVQACHGVEEAHGAGIVHRDLKPSNLYVVRRQNGKACLKVLDFGISKSMSSDGVNVSTLTGSRVVLGSPHYMSPEQVRDARSVDHRTDVWSLGVILYQLLAGRPAFSASTFAGIYAAVAADTPASLRSLRPEAPPELERVVAACLERDLSARFQSVAELRRALEPFSQTEPDFDELLTSLASGRGSALAVRGSGAPPTESASGSDAFTPVVLADATHTQLSESPRSSERGHLEDRTQRSPSGIPASKESGRRRILVLTCAALGISGIILYSRSSEPTDEEVRPKAVTLSFESRPSGARLREGDSFYGTTPLEVQISPAPGGLPRHFALELSGYRPYLVEHRVEQGSIRVRAELIPEPGPGPSESAGKQAPGAKRRPAPRPLSSRPSASVEVPPPQIRLQR